MPSPDPDSFHYDGFAIDPAAGQVRCTYSTGPHRFTETYTFGPAGNWSDPSVQAAVRILYLLAGVSYYKTTAAPTIDLGHLVSTGSERAFLTGYLIDGLGEFAYRNSLDLGHLHIIGPEAAEPTTATYTPTPSTPLIPFGGGIDSIVTVQSVRADHPNASLLVVHPTDDTFDAIEGAASATGLPIVRVARTIDPLVRRSAELGFLNGHVPITAVISAAAVVAAVLGGHDAVILSNEWSASTPTLHHHGHPVNHQWSKSSAFEASFAELVAGSLGPELSVFSYLRPRSELWVAEQFAHLTQFHQVFRSCNRAFHQDRSQRLDHWCGECDKCCFINLILSPFIPAAELAAVFEGNEPLANLAREPQFRALLELGTEPKPFECVGDVGECRAALRLASARPDREGASLLHTLSVDLAHAGSNDRATQADLLAPIGPHYIPERYAPPDLLARAH